MKQILLKYMNKKVGINLTKPFHIESATLVNVEFDYFSIKNDQEGNIHHFSFNSIVQIIENEDGVNVGGFFTHKETYPVIIKVGHILEYIPPA